jgi:serine/threonine-protein phosphatase 2A regulatory subunit B''
MVKPEVAGRITVKDLERCGCAGTVFEILCDHTGFWQGWYQEQSLDQR